MKIKHSVWKQCTKIGSWLALPAVLILFLYQNGSGLFHQVVYYVAFSFVILCGLTGAIVAILQRFGVIEFTYSEKEKQKTSFQISKLVAERERHIWGGLFSAKYYKSFYKSDESNDDKTKKNQK
jgi:cytochrome b